jgi:universal bacterial protein yeaZ
MSVVLLLKTDQADCYVELRQAERQQQFSWQAGRNLSDGLLQFLQQCLKEFGAEWADLSGLVVFRGPGSYTSLRIGLTVANTMASSLQIPIVGADGEQWQSDGLARLSAGKDDKIVLPIYLQPVHITQPKK